MKLNKFFYFSFLLLLIVGVAALARQKFNGKQPEDQKNLLNPLEEYGKIISHLSDTNLAKNVSGVIDLYDGATPAILKESQKFEYYHSNNDFYSSLGYQKTIVNNDVGVTLDSVNKLLIISDVKASQIGVNPFGSFQPGQSVSDTSMTDFSKEVKENGNERTITYSLTMTPQVRSYSLVYDKNSYQVKSAKIIWWKTGSAVLDSAKTNDVWITHVRYRYGALPQMNLNKAFQEIVQVKNGKVIVAPAYQSYDIKVASN